MNLKWKEILAHWLRFHLVGGVGVGVQLGILFFLVSGLGMNHLVATVLAVELTIIHNFFWHEYWTWSKLTRNNHGKWWKRIIQFNLTTGLTSIIGNVGIMYLLVDLFGWNYLLANGVAIALGSMINFLASHLVIFRQSATVGK